MANAQSALSPLTPRYSIAGTGNSEKALSDADGREVEVSKSDAHVSVSSTASPLALWAKKHFRTDVVKPVFAPSSKAAKRKSVAVNVAIFDPFQHGISPLQTSITILSNGEEDALALESFLSLMKVGGGWGRVGVYVFTRSPPDHGRLSDEGENGKFVAPPLGQRGFEVSVAE